MNNMYDNNIENSRKPNTNIQVASQNPYIVQDNTQAQQTMQNPEAPSANGFDSGDFLKGALVGAAVTFLLTNKGAQESIMGAFSKGSELFQAGMEELKERYEDAKAQKEAGAGEEF